MAAETEQATLQLSKPSETTLQWSNPSDSQTGGAEDYFKALQEENAAMEAEIARLEQTKKGFDTDSKRESTSPTKGIKIISWDPPVVTTAGVDTGSPHRPKQTAERKKDGTFFCS